jgi:hypothetical protein
MDQSPQELQQRAAKYRKMAQQVETGKLLIASWRLPKNLNSKHSNSSRPP